MSAALSREDRDLLRFGVGGEGHPVADALFALMRARVAELTEGLIRAEGAGEVSRLQGALIELRRWAAYGEELAARAAMMEADDGPGDHSLE